MAFKFFNIGKANEEITRLETRNAELEAENKSFKENDSAVADEAAKQGTQLEASQASVTRLEAEKKAADARISQLEKDVTEAKTSADKLAAAKALEITAAQGQPPITSGTGTVTGDGSDLIYKHSALLQNDPMAAMEFYQKNKAAYDAAWKARKTA